MELIKQYQDLYVEFCKIDDFNLEDRAKKVPAEKHFWVARLIQAKIDRDRLLKQKKGLSISLTKQVASDNRLVAASQRDIEAMVNTSDTMEEINEKIRQQDFLVEYLELLVKQVTFIAQDIKNIIEIRKLETT